MAKASVRVVKTATTTTTKSRTKKAAPPKQCPSCGKFTGKK